MAFYFGLNVNRNLTDINDATEALKNINLDIADLQRIKGITDPGNVTRSDFRCLSGLDVDLEKTLGSLISETSNYNVLTTNFYDENSYLDNNLIVNGQFASTSIKYNYLENTTNAIKTADISTSRVSSWSSFSNDAGAPIFYGGQVLLQGSLEASELVILGQAEAKRFESEIPTHRIEVEVNGEKIYLLAMKGIPLVFKGFFRNATNIFASVNVTRSLRPSWIIKNANETTEYVYQNVLTGSRSQITFKDTTAKEREILFYYPADNITNLGLGGINLYLLPEIVLPNLTYLDISNNDFREMPNLSGFTSLQSLYLQNNNLTRSSTTTLRLFNSQVVARLPTSLRNLNLGNCYTGTSTADLSALPLVNLTLDSGSTYNRRLSGVSPAVNGSTIETYNIVRNLFTNVHSSVKNSTSLKNIYLDYNNFRNTDMYFNSPNIENYSSTNNFHNLVDLSGKTKLKNYTFVNNNIAGGNKTVTSIFSGCQSLENINLYGSSVEGAFPAFLGCTSLRTIDFRFTRVTDAVPAAGGNPAYAIGQTTFDACRGILRDIRIRSPQFTTNSEFHPDCLGVMPSLTYLEISSDNRGITGSLPSFATVRSLQYLLMYNNRLNGLIPNFTNNEKIFFINLSNNFLSGSVPNVPHKTLQHLILTNNRLETFDKIDSTSLVRIHLAFNNLKGIPDLSNLTVLQELLLNNQRLASGQTLKYTAGSFIGLRALNNLNLANNSITQGSVDQILIDLLANYTKNPRRNVIVNLRGNAAPSSTEEVQSSITRLRAGGWTVLTN